VIIGYHLTSRGHWDSIRRGGLQPYPIDHPEVAALLRATCGTDRAIWCWTEPPAGVDLLGCVFDRVAHKHATEIVLVRAEFPAADLAGPTRPGESWKMTHRGSIAHERRRDAWVYHEARPYHLVLRPVPPGRLTLAARWDLVALLERGLRRRPRRWWPDRGRVPSDS
jgi:hypothetical protein